MINRNLNSNDLKIIENALKEKCTFESWADNNEGTRFLLNVHMAFIESPENKIRAQKWIRNHLEPLGYDPFRINLVKYDLDSKGGIFSISFIKFFEN